MVVVGVMVGLAVFFGSVKILVLPCSLILLYVRMDLFSRASWLVLVKLSPSKSSIGVGVDVPRGVMLTSIMLFKSPINRKIH